MALTLILWTILLQMGPVQLPPEVRVIDGNVEMAQVMEQKQRLADELEKRHFEERFNTLVNALQSFAKEYNKGHGNVWPLRQAEALQKACHDLERSRFLKSKPLARPEVAAE